jgi:hypothetical protein
VQLIVLDTRDQISEPVRRRPKIHHAHD